MRLWGGRFDDEPDARMADFTRSIDVDAELALDDIAGSIAHVRGLGRAGLLTDEEVATLEGGLAALRLDVEARRDRLGPVPRGRPPQPRDAAHGPRRRRRRQAPHRALAQRPGGDGPAPLVPARGRPPRRRRSWGWSGPWSAWPSARATRSSRGRPTSSRPSPCCSPTTSSRTSRCWSETAAGSPTRAAGSTSRRWAPGRWRAPATRSTARRRRGSSASTASPPTRWTPSRTATSSSSCWPRPRSRWCT